MTTRECARQLVAYELVVLARKLRSIDIQPPRFARFTGGYFWSSWNVRRVNTPAAAWLAAPSVGISRGCTGPYCTCDHEEIMSQRRFEKGQTQVKEEIRRPAGDTALISACFCEHRHDHRPKARAWLPTYWDVQRRWQPTEPLAGGTPPPRNRDTTRQLNALGRRGV